MGRVLNGSLDEILERLEGGRADLLGSRLALDGDGLAVEGVGAGAVFGGGLLDGLELEEAGDDELAGPTRTKLLLDDLGETVEDAVDALLVELGQLGELGDNLGLGETLVCHEIPP